MNGILLFGIPEIIIQFIYGSIAVINICLINKKIYPAYKKVLVNNKYYKKTTDYINIYC